MLGKTITFGKKEKFAIEIKIDEIEKQEDKSISFFGNAFIWIKNHKIGDPDEDYMLGFFYVDIEAFYYSIEKEMYYNNDFLFNISEKELLALSKEFFFNNEEGLNGEIFNNLFWKSRIPLDSHYFNKNNIIMLKRGQELIFRVWDNDEISKNIHEFIIPKNEILIPCKSFLDFFDDLVLKNKK